MTRRRPSADRPPLPALLRFNRRRRHGAGLYGSQADIYGFTPVISGWGGRIRSAGVAIRTSAVTRSTQTRLDVAPL